MRVIAYWMCSNRFLPRSVDPKLDKVPVKSLSARNKSSVWMKERKLWDERSYIQIGEVRS
eukprot:scaffold550655_cov63-Attheya_sp.AAC.1